MAVMPAQRTTRYKACRLVPKKASTGKTSPKKAAIIKKKQTAESPDPASRKLRTQPSRPAIEFSSLSPKALEPTELTEAERCRIAAEFAQKQRAVMDRLRAQEEKRHVTIDKHTSALTEVNQELLNVDRELSKKAEGQLRRAAKQLRRMDSAAALFGLSQKLKIMNQKV